MSSTRLVSIRQRCRRAKDVPVEVDFPRFLLLYQMARLAVNPGFCKWKVDRRV
jgi:hypothetical protein